MIYQEIKARTEALRGVRHTPLERLRLMAQNAHGLPLHVRRELADIVSTMDAAPEAVADRAQLVGMIDSLRDITRNVIAVLESDSVEYDDIRTLLQGLRAALAKVQS